MLDGFCNGGINIAQAQICRSKLHVHFAHAAFVASAFKFSGDERVKNFFGSFERSFFAAQASTFTSL
jgi:hypothetical protein